MASTLVDVEADALAPTLRAGVTDVGCDGVTVEACEGAPAADAFAVPELLAARDALSLGDELTLVKGVDTEALELALALGEAGGLGDAEPDVLLTGGFRDAVALKLALELALGDAAV